MEVHADEDSNEIRPRVYNFFHELSMQFIMFINVKMPTIVGIVTFISTINTTSESLKAGKAFCFHEQLKFRAQFS